MTAAAPETAKPTPEAAPAAKPEDKVTPSPATVITEPPVAKPAAEVDPKKEPEVSKTGEVKFDLKLPEGSLLAAETVESIKATALAEKWTPEKAQAELQKQSDLVKTFVEGEKAKLDKTVNDWVEESKKDTEIGGEKFLANAEVAKRVVNRFGTEAFKKALNESGLGNHPELLRVFVRIGRAMTEDQMVHPSGNPTTPRSAADVLYGDASTNKEK